jgi:predicted neuraminidase
LRPDSRSQEPLARSRHSVDGAQRRSIAALATPLVLSCLTTAATAQSSPAITQAELIFEQAPFPSCHASTLVEATGGDLIAAWFGGTAERHPDVSIWTARLDRGSPRWSAPAAVADGVEDGVDYPCWNPVLHRPSHRPANGDSGDAGPILLFYKVGPSPSEWWGMLLRSEDDGRTWSRPERLPEGILGPIRAKPLELPDGTLLAGSSTEHDGWRLHFERTRDLGRTWESTGPIHDGRALAAIQPAFLAHPAGRIQALARSRQNRIVETWSNDGGRTWSEPRATALPNPSAGIDALTLPDGRHLLVYNHTSSLPGEKPRAETSRPTPGPAAAAAALGTRSELNLAVSDDGERWRAALLLERQPGEYSYPAMIRTRDGLVHITYTWRRQSIRHVVIDPAKLEPRDFVDGSWPD